MEKITAAGGVLFKVEEGELYVLLIHRRGVWDLPKGKREEGEDIKECAEREVEEEVGCASPQSLEKLNTTFHEYDHKGTRIGKTTHWYAMKTSTEEGFTPQQEEGIQRVDWFSLDEAIQKVGYENLNIVLSSFRQWYSRTC